MANIRQRAPDELVLTRFVTGVFLASAPRGEVSGLFTSRTRLFHDDTRCPNLHS